MNKSLVILLGLALSGLILFAGCAPAVPATPPLPSVPLERTSWVLLSFVESGREVATLAGSPVTVIFDPVRGQVSGKAGCNNYFGSYKLESGKLSLASPIGSTMMACAPPVLEQESRYLKALQGAQGFTIEGDKLIITCGATQLLFKGA